MSERLSYSPAEAKSNQESLRLFDNFTKCPIELQFSICNKATDIMSRNYYSSIRSNINY